MHVLLASVIMAVGGIEAAPNPNAGSTSRQFEARRVAGDSVATGPMISYEIRYVTLNDPDWRGKFDPWLKSVARQGGSAVWAVDASTTEELLSYWQANAACKVLEAPKVVTPSGGEVQFVNEERIHYVAHLERLADGPANHATRLAFKPEIDQIHHGVRTRLTSGRVESQGLCARVTIDSDRLLSFQTSIYSETVVPAMPGKEDPATVSVPGKGRHGQARPAKLNATIQVPVVDSARVDGEWVIPQGGALIVSLGTSRIQGKSGREVRPEELVVIRFKPEPGQSPTPTE